MQRLLSFTIAALLPGLTAQAEEATRWDFESGTGGWESLHHCEVKHSDGLLQIRSVGNDPHLRAPVEAPAGWKKLTINARGRGRHRAQLFWTTDQHSGTSEARSVRFDWRGNGKKTQAYHVYFHPRATVTSLRLDPTDRKATIAVASIVLSNETPPRPDATSADAIKVLDGFKVERLYSVSPEAEGSWVSLTHDNKGRLITSDQYGKLYRITPGKDEASTTVEPLNVGVGMAQGLLYAFDSLYVMVNGTDAKNQGLWRLTDTNGDDTFDKTEHLRHLKGGGEHGPHAVILSPDGKSLYVCAGNHTDPPTFEKTLVPPNYKEDQLLPRMWDAGGHAVGKMAPGGWIARVNPDGSEWTLVASGFRNEYDIAFNQHGELFTYDADMEWDVGSPWYRPTRVNHVTSGGEFGWRSGTGKWPDWYEDSLGAVVNIGPGSPTGITFGTNAKFPSKYQHALFTSDWSYGVVYAVHMTPDGSSYTGTSERFLSAAPLPVTDLVVNPGDGALYFTIGGRRTQSGLYRVTHKDSASNRPAALASTNEKQRQLRQKLESMHRGDIDTAGIDFAWQHLGHADRHTRFAARIVLEHAPVDAWKDRALKEEDPGKLIPALIALCRCGDKSLQLPVLQSIARVAGSELSPEQDLAALRVLELAFARFGEPPEGLANLVGATIDGLYPANNARVDRELSQLLIYLQNENAASKTVALLKNAASQEEQIQYALWLRNLKKGWTPELRREYFAWFNQANSLRGGNSFSRFIENIRKEAIENLSEEEKVALADVLEAKAEPLDPTAELDQRPVVKKWTVDELLPVVTANAGRRDFANGKKMFAVTACYKCHRFAGTGGIVGPDLTGVSGRFSNKNLLESLIEPSKVVSDQYQATSFLLEDGKTITGRIANLSGKTLMVIDDMLNPGAMKRFSVDDVEEQMLSKVSMMPAGLLDRLTSDEILDLVAYLKSGGNPDHSIYKLGD